MTLIWYDVTVSRYAKIH